MRRETFLQDGLILHARDSKPGVLQVLLVQSEVEGLLILRVVVLLDDARLLPLHLLRQEIRRLL